MDQDRDLMFTERGLTPAGHRPRSSHRLDGNRTRQIRPVVRVALLQTLSMDKISTSPAKRQLGLPTLEMTQVPPASSSHGRTPVAATPACGRSPRASERFLASGTVSFLHLRTLLVDSKDLSRRRRHTSSPRAHGPPHSFRALVDDVHSPGGSGIDRAEVPTKWIWSSIV